MPYIKQNVAESIRNGRVPETKGGLNYAISELLARYLKHHGVCYSSINDVQGALDNAAREFDHRITRPYEAQARKRHATVDPYLGVARAAGD